MSDGTSTLHFLDPLTFQPIGQLQVMNGSLPVVYLNELEYVKGEIYAQCLAVQPHRPDLTANWTSH